MAPKCGTLGWRGPAAGILSVVGIVLLTLVPFRGGGVAQAKSAASRLTAQSRLHRAARKFTAKIETSAGHAGLDKTPCVYSAESISQLHHFGEIVGRAFNCAMVYNDTDQNWSQWDDPWFLGGTEPDNAWARWATAPRTSRELIITQGLFPSSEDHADWVGLGATGAFDTYARILARHLVAAGLGSSVIRLAAEANDTSQPYAVPDTPKGDAKWIEFWRRTVMAMRSVPGAHFVFDWTVNAAYRNIPLSSFYPGDDVVDIVGVDTYDAGLPITGNARWGAIADEPDGLRAVSAFARSHNKPMSIPEWGIGPAQGSASGFAGDDPAFVQGIAGIVRRQNVAYQSYFLAHDEGTQLLSSPNSLGVYERAFGVHGSAVGQAARVK